MTTAKPWWRKRTFQDAPASLNGPEALSWASGWNAAVRAYEEQLSIALAAEQSDPEIHVSNRPHDPEGR